MYEYVLLYYSDKSFMMVLKSGVSPPKGVSLFYSKYYHSND